MTVNLPKFKCLIGRWCYINRTWKTIETMPLCRCSKYFWWADNFPNVVCNSWWDQCTIVASTVAALLEFRCLTLPQGWMASYNCTRHLTLQNRTLVCKHRKVGYIIHHTIPKETLATCPSGVVSLREHTSHISRYKTSGSTLNWLQHSKWTNITWLVSPHTINTWKTSQISH